MKGAWAFLVVRCARLVLIVAIMMMVTSEIFKEVLVILNLHLHEMGCLLRNLVLLVKGEKSYPAVETVLSACTIPYVVNDTNDNFPST